MRRLVCLSILLVSMLLSASAMLNANPRPSRTLSFDGGWLFHLGDVAGAQEPHLDDSAWRKLNLPHDWSVEGEFSEKHPAGFNGGALPGGIGWYRKSFTLPDSAKNGQTFIDFDGVYRNSEVWINGHALGKRPYGYSSFRYDLTPYLTYGPGPNVIAVRVDNSQQPNSRWYSGSGIYRHVWLTTTDKVFVDHWGTFITTPRVSEASATVSVRTKIRNRTGASQPVILTTIIYNAAGREVGRAVSRETMQADYAGEISQELSLNGPILWTLENPHLYRAVSQVEYRGRVADRYETPFGVRSFVFDRERGFLLNGRQVKIKGVCEHHDLGSLGAAVNNRALERQLEILKAMGVNGIRTSHNPPAPELLELADRMGFVVMDEAFDMWKKKKTDFDYHLDWDQWHRRDLEDMVLRDRNHPSIFIWSIGNEIPEQWDESGGPIATELVGIVKNLDTTRPVTSALNFPEPKNSLIRSGALDLIGYNYRQNDYPKFLQTFPGQKFIASETTSALATRGSYDMPSDVIRRWPNRWDKPFDEGNPDFSCSSYDNCSAGWGSTHEETWKVVKKYDYLSGMFIWTGFDYLGEPTPYPWPARSSYFGIVDLAGFPKDAFYMYQSEWTSKPVLHIFPHWNWKTGDNVDVWAYYNNADEVELFLNGKSLGTKRKTGDDLHVMWRVPYEAGTLRGVARRGGREVMTDEVRTAGKPARLLLSADRKVIRADGSDLSFVTVRVVDEQGTLVPRADNLVEFGVRGEGFIAGVDNGSQVSHESFKAPRRKAFNGMCLAIIQSKARAGRITLKATSEGLPAASLTIDAR